MKLPLTHIFYLLLLSVSLSAKAQLINPPIGEEFGVHQKFNANFVKNNHIAEISCLIEVKKDGDRIRSTYEKELYHFYDNGSVKMVSSINYRLLDTAITYFEYVGDRLDCEVKNDAAGMFSYCYTYDDDGKPTARRYGRSERQESLTASLNTDLGFEITAEKYTYARFENQLHCTLFNSSGRPYQKEIRYFDDNNYLYKYLRTFIMSSAKREEDYTYEDHGWLSEKTIDDGKVKYTLKYTYDDVGNVLEEQRFDTGELTYRKEYVYKGENMLVNAELKRDEINHLIVITTYTYKYR